MNNKLKAAEKIAELRESMPKTFRFQSQKANFLLERFRFYENTASNQAIKEAEDV